MLLMNELESFKLLKSLITCEGGSRRRKSVENETKNVE